MTGIFMRVVLETILSHFRKIGLSKNAKLEKIVSSILQHVSIQRHRMHLCRFLFLVQELRSAYSI